MLADQIVLSWRISPPRIGACDRRLSANGLPRSTIGGVQSLRTAAGDSNPASCLARAEASEMVRSTSGFSAEVCDVWWTVRRAPLRITAYAAETSGWRAYVIACSIAFTSMGSCGAFVSNTHRPAPSTESTKSARPRSGRSLGFFRPRDCRAYVSESSREMSLDVPRRYPNAASRGSATSARTSVSLAPSSFKQSSSKQTEERRLT